MQLPRSARRPGVVMVILLVLVPVVAMAAAHPAAAAPVPLYPDLVSQIPPGGISIDHSVAADREFRYTHRIANLGAGPLEVRPEYDPTTDNARGFQRLYQRDNATVSLASESAIGGQLLYHAVHGHYHYPLASFGLYATAADGSVGTPVAMSPKVGFCIADSIPVTGSAGSSEHSPGNCGDPRATVGITPGWADEYDARDDGQSIPINGLPDGTYWLRTIVDPDNYLVESNNANNITDVKVKITGDTVAVLGTITPVIAPPTVAVVSPHNGDTVAGSVTLSATATDPAGITGLEYLIDGVAVTPRLSTPPYSFAWDTTGVTNGSHLVTARAFTGAGLRGASPTVLVNVSNAAVGGGIAIDVSVSRDGRGPLTTPPITTSSAGETLLALVSSDGPGGGAQTATVTGAGLSWRLVRRANGQPGAADIWTATAPQPLVAATVTATSGIGGFDASLSVVAFQNAGGVGASSGASAPTGVPSVSLTTTRDGSWVFGTGNDWDNAVGRVVPADQRLVHQFLDTGPGDTMWAQSTLTPSAGAGSVVNLRDLSPATDRWNLAAVEVLPAGVGTPGPIISNVLAGARTSSSAVITWTTDVPSTSAVDFGTTLSYGQSSPVDPTLTTSHRVTLSGLASETQYHYRVSSTDAAGITRRSVDFVFTTAAISTLFCDLTSPAAGATLSGTVAVTANASSTASVAGVQFKVDNVNLGAEDAAPPYSVNWDTTTAANGAHTLTAVVRDPTGNSLTSASVAVTVTNTTTTGPVGLVAAYSFNEGSGTLVHDLSGKANTGTLSGATWSAAGRYGGALSFNGVNNRVDVPDSPSLRLTTGMTVEAWLRPTTTNAAWRSAVLKEQPGGLAYALYSQTTANRPSGYVNTGGADVEVRAGGPLAANTWTHVAITYDGTAVRIYRAGALVATAPTAGPIVTAAGALRIGGNTIWGEYFAGLIDEIRIYNRALTATEITTDLNLAL